MHSVRLIGAANSDYRAFRQSILRAEAGAGGSRNLAARRFYNLNLRHHKSGAPVHCVVQPGQPSAVAAGGGNYKVKENDVIFLAYPKLEKGLDKNMMTYWKVRVKSIDNQNKQIQVVGSMNPNQEPPRGTDGDPDTDLSTFFTSTVSICNQGIKNCEYVRNLDNNKEASRQQELLQATKQFDNTIVKDIMVGEKQYKIRLSNIEDDKEVEDTVHLLKEKTKTTIAPDTIRKLYDTEQAPPAEAEAEAEAGQSSPVVYIEYICKNEKKYTSPGLLKWSEQQEMRRGAELIYLESVASPITILTYIRNNYSFVNSELKESQDFDTCVVPLDSILEHMVVFETVSDSKDFLVFVKNDDGTYKKSEHTISLKKGRRTEEHKKYMMRGTEYAKKVLVSVMLGRLGFKNNKQGLKEYYSIINMMKVIPASIVDVFKEPAMKEVYQIFLESSWRNAEKEKYELNKPTILVPAANRAQCDDNYRMCKKLESTDVTTHNLSVIEKPELKEGDIVTGKDGKQAFYLDELTGNQVCDFKTSKAEWKNTIMTASRIYYHKNGQDKKVDAIVIVKGCGSSGCKA